MWIKKVKKPALYVGLPIAITLVVLAHIFFGGFLREFWGEDIPKPFINHIVQSGNRYSLLVECGTKSSPIPVNLVINTNSEYLDVRFGLGKPNQSVFSPNIMTYIGVRETKGQKYYALTMNSPVVTQSSSMYGHFESDKPIDIISVRFAGRTLN